MARPSKYTPDAVHRIEQAIRVGTSYQLAAAYAGIAESTLHD